MVEHESAANNNAIDDSIPLLWQQRGRLAPLLATYGARVLGKAVARRFNLEHARTSCHLLAALMMALTDFREAYD